MTPPSAMHIYAYRSNATNFVSDRRFSVRNLGKFVNCVSRIVGGVKLRNSGKKLCFVEVIIHQCSLSLRRIIVLVQFSEANIKDYKISD